MSHHIYHTKGIVLSGTNVGEANKFLTIFTRELGVITAHAQSLRAMQSKLRYSLQEFSYATIDLVKGRDIWRVTSAGHIPFLDSAKKDVAKLTMLGNFSRLLKRLVNGEEENEELFDVFFSVLRFVEDETLSMDELKAVENIFVLRTLFVLGYVSEDDSLSVFLHNALSRELVVFAELQQVFLITRINESLKETQL